MDFSQMGRWLERLQLDETYLQALSQRVDAERAAGAVYPPEDAVLRAFRLTPPEAVRVVLVGQDPYHGPGEANGLAFSVQAGVRIPPSLRNIFRELREDLGQSPPPDGDLSGWARQGVLLLNTVLTVRAHAANSHKALGWQRLTEAAISAVRQLPQPVAFVLWGAHAQKLAPLAADSPYPRRILQAPHPSPLSAYHGFFGSRPFSQINRFLTEHGEAPIDFSAG